MQKIGDIPNSRADSNGEFTDGNVAGGVPPTILPAEWFNTLQRELMSVLSAANIDADSEKFDQVATAVSKLITDGGFLKTANNLVEIKNAGPAAVAETLLNLGLGDAAKLGVATNAQMTAGTASNLLPSVAAVMNLFNKRAFTANDYIRIPDVPGGLIVQWGLVTSGASGDAPWIYPTPFPNTRLGVWGIFHRLGVAGTDFPTISFNNISDPTPKTLTNFHLRANGVAGAFSAFVFAIGN